MQFSRIDFMTYIQEFYRVGGPVSNRENVTVKKIDNEQIEGFFTVHTSKWDKVHIPYNRVISVVEEQSNDTL